MRELFVHLIRLFLFADLVFVYTYYIKTVSLTVTEQVLISIFVGFLLTAYIATAIILDRTQRNLEEITENLESISSDLKELNN